MNCFLVDKKIYVLDKDNVQVYEKSNIKDLLLASGKNISVAVIDALPKIIKAKEDNNSHKDIIIANLYGDEYLVNDEHVNKDTYQAVGIKKSIIEDVYSLFKDKNILSFVPYACAIRAYIKLNNIDSKSHGVVFIDNIKDQILLTVFDDLVYSATRVIPSKDIGKIDSEIKRSIKVFQKDNIDFKKEWIIVTNCPDVEVNVAKSTLLSDIKVVKIADSFPCLTGLNNASFNIHFQLPEVIFANKKLKDNKSKMIFVSISVCLLGFSSIFCLFANISKSITKTRLRALNTSKIELTEKLSSLNSTKLKDIIISSKKMSYSELLLDFITNIPDGYKIASISLKKNSNDNWIFEGIISIDSKLATVINFYKTGNFKDCSIEHISLKKIYAQKIVLRINM